jgi:hypothetical protein
MPLKNKADQTADAIVLRDATVPEENTALRVYNLVKNLIDSALFYDQVKQITGSSTTDVMSQKAVTDALTALAGGVPPAGDTLAKLYNLIGDIGTLVGSWNSSSLPTTGSDPSGAINKGDYWKINGTITIAGIGDLKSGDTLVASIAGAAVAADFFALQNNVDQATSSVLGLVKLYTNLSASNTDGSVTQAALVTALALLAPLASPAFTGTPTAPTAPEGTNTTQIATTEFVHKELNRTYLNAT